MNTSITTLSEPHRALLSGPLASWLAAADANLWAQAARVWGVEFEAGLLRVVLLDRQTEALRRLLAPGARVALNCTDPVSTHGVQFKGRVEAMEPPSEHARNRADQRIAQFEDALVSMSFERGTFGGLAAPGAARELSISVHAVYDQTPGPGAGKEVSP